MHPRLIEGEREALVITTADKRGDLPRFRLPEDNTLLPACLILMASSDYNGEIAISLGFVVAAMSVSLRRATLLAFIGRPGLG